MLDTNFVQRILVIGSFVVLGFGLWIVFVFIYLRTKEWRENYKKVTGLPRILPCPNGQIFHRTSEARTGKYWIFVGEISTSGAYLGWESVAFYLPIDTLEFQLILCGGAYYLVDMSGNGPKVKAYKQDCTDWDLPELINRPRLF